jgi:hypothetical protein
LKSLLLLSWVGRPRLLVCWIHCSDGGAVMVCWCPGILPGGWWLAHSVSFEDYQISSP